MKWKHIGLWAIGILVIGMHFGCSTRSKVYSSPEPASPKEDIVFTQASVQTKSKIKNLFVFNFDTQSDDDQPWGSMCSRIVSLKINYAPHELVHIPSLFRIMPDLMDSNIITSKISVLSLEMGKYYAKAYGTDNLLQGTIIKKGNSIGFQGSLINITTDSTVSQIEESGLMSEPEDFFNHLANKVVTVLSIQLDDSTRNYLNQKNTGNSKAFPIAMQAFNSKGLENQEISDIYLRAIEKDPDFLFAYFGAADWLPDSQLASAMNILKEAEKKFPDNSIIPLRIIDKNKDAVKNQEVIQLAEKFLKIEPENQEALSYCVGAYGSVSDYSTALEYARKEIRLYPNCWFSYTNYAWYASQLADSARKGRYYNMMNTQQKQVFSENMLRSYQAIQRAYQLHPKNLTVLVDVIDIYKENAVDLSVIEEAFSQATVLYPHDVRPYRGMQWVYGLGYYNEPEKSIHLLVEGLNANPDNLDFAFIVLDHAYWDDVHNRSPRMVDATIQKATDLIKKITDEHPGDPYKIWKIAEFYYNHKKFKEALTYYQNLPTPPKNANITLAAFYIHKAWIYNQLNQNQISVEYADKGLDADPDKTATSDAYIIKAVDCYQQSQIDKGFDFMEQAVQVDPTRTFALDDYANYAVWYSSHLDKGLEYINKALEIDPQNPNFYHRLAQVRYVRKEKSLALKAIDKSLEFDPENTVNQKLKIKIQTLP